MDKNSFIFQMSLTGRGRKEAAKIIASYFEAQAVYQGAPSIAYVITESFIREWRIDKNGAIIAHGTKGENIVTVFTVLKDLEENGVTAEGRAGLRSA